MSKICKGYTKTSNYKVKCNREAQDGNYCDEHNLWSRVLRFKWVYQILLGLSLIGGLSWHYAIPIYNYINDFKTNVKTGNLEGKAILSEINDETKLFTNGSFLEQEDEILFPMKTKIGIKDYYLKITKNEQQTFISAIFSNSDGEPVGEIINNRFTLNPNNLFKVKRNKRVFEVIDNRDKVVLQIVHLKERNELHINGIFFDGKGYLIFNKNISIYLTESLVYHENNGCALPLSLIENYCDYDIQGTNCVKSKDRGNLNFEINRLNKEVQKQYEAMGYELTESGLILKDSTQYKNCGVLDSLHRLIKPNNQGTDSIAFVFSNISLKDYRAPLTFINNYLGGSKSYGTKLQLRNFGMLHFQSYPSNYSWYSIMQDSLMKYYSNYQQVIYINREPSRNQGELFNDKALIFDFENNMVFGYRVPSYTKNDSKFMTKSTIEFMIGEYRKQKDIHIKKMNSKLNKSEKLDPSNIYEIYRDPSKDF